MSPKYNRTMHLPWSDGRGNEDKVASSVESLLNREIIITEKMDGSNVSLEKEGCFARSHSGPPTHKSFDGLKLLHATLLPTLEENVQYFGEWCFAKHSILYSKLPAYFLLFGVKFLSENCWADWDHISSCSQKLNVPTVPVLWTGTVRTVKELESLTIELAKQKSECGGEREGIVVRIYEQFLDRDFSNYIMKFVRKDHVQTTEHWKNKEIIKNGLINHYYK